MFPTLCRIHTINATGAAAFNTMFCLIDVDTVVVRGRAKVFEMRCSFIVKLQSLSNAIINLFGNRFELARHEEVVNLTEHEDCVAFKDGMVDAFVVSCWLKVKEVVTWFFVDVFFSWTSRFWMSLECVLCQKHKCVVDFLSKFMLILVSVGAINLYKRWSFWWG